MSVEPDLFGYALGELDEAERREVERYLAAHPDAALEVERIRGTAMLVKRLPEEEPPRRIAFVSDKVFERRWWQISLWQGLAFTSAMALAVSIFAHGLLMRPLPVAAEQPRVVALTEQQIEARIEARVQAELAKVVAAQEQRSKQLVAAALDDAEKKYSFERQADRVAMEETVSVLRKQMARFYVASNDIGVRP